MWLNHIVIILLERACLHNRIGRNWCKFSRAECATSQSDVTRDCSSLANGPSFFFFFFFGGGGVGWGRVCILRSPGIPASPISLLSMGGVCGRSLTAGKILITGRQTCSLYLVLWLCGLNIHWAKISYPKYGIFYEICIFIK